MSIKLAQQSTHLHMNPTLIFQPFQLPRRIALKQPLNIRRIHLRQARI